MKSPRSVNRAVGVDHLLFVEHPHVVTRAQRTRRKRAGSGGSLSRQGIELHETDRGGDVTYHGPGQIVGYPIMDLTPGSAMWAPIVRGHRAGFD